MSNEKKVTIVPGQDLNKISKFQAKVRVSHMRPVEEEYSLAQVEQLIANEDIQINNLNKAIDVSKKRIAELLELKSEIEKAVIGTSV